MRTVRTLLLAVSLATALAGMRSVPHQAALSATATPRAAAAKSGAVTSASAPLATPSTGDTVRDVPENLVSRDERQAKVVLGELGTSYRHLEGATVTMGSTPNGEQAVAYYMDGRIVIDRAHTVAIDDILAHEIWHIIDWRDNGRLDWGESVPPSNPEAYLKK